jgi:DNA-binding SARP family transcriptional activator
MLRIRREKNVTRGRRDVAATIRLRFELLGGFAVMFDDGSPCVLPTRKTQALLAYLALPAGRFHSREKITALLWGDTPEAQARQSCRQALARVRRAVGDGLPVILTRGDTLALNPEIVAIDVAELESALADRSLAGRLRAATLYKGDLLDGFSLNEATFEDWRLLERERLRERTLDGLAGLLREQLNAARPEPAIQTALRLLSMDPLQEAVHRDLMTLLLRQGRRAAALQQYQVCVATLERELAAEPEEATRELYRQILRAAGTGATRSSSKAPRALASTMTASAAQSPLIGREAELERLRTALSRMQDTGGNTLLLSGEAGIGKTRLIQDFAGEALSQGARVLVGHCHETEQALPLNPWIEALRADRLTLDPGLRDRLGATTGAELVRVFPELSTPDEQPAIAGAQHALLFDALVELIGTEAAERPIVLVIEDLHWADSMSARFLAYFGRRVHRLPVLLVGSMRPEDLLDAPILSQALAELRAQGRLEEIPLRALAKDETRLLARCLHAGARRGRVGSRMVDEVWMVSEGNPFVVVESMQAIRDEARDSGRVGSPLARSVRDFVAARLDRLGERARHLVATAAVIGRDFSFALLARAARVSEREAAETVEELVRRRVLDTIGDRLEFSHDWIRRVADDRLLPATRPTLHAAVGAALEELHHGRLDDVADQLGNHYSRAGDFRKALPNLVRFAELAAQRYALEEASRAFEHALATVDQLPTSEHERARHRAALHERIGDMYALQWSADAGASHYRRGIEFWQAAGKENPQTGARLYAKLAEAPTRFRGAFKTPPSEAEVVGYIDAGLALLGTEGDSIEKARLLMAKACLPNLSERRDEAELQQAIESGRKALPIMQSLGSPRDVSAVLDAIGSSYTHVGDYPAALESHVARRELREHIDDRAELIDISCMLARSYVAVGEYEQAVTEAQQAVDLGQIGLGGWHIHALLWRTWSYFSWDKWDEASASFQEFLKIWDGYGGIYQTFIGELFLLEAALAARRGDDDTASEHARIADDYVLRRLLHLPALVQLARGRVDQARSALEALAADRGRLMPVVQTNLLEVHAMEQQGSQVEARADAVLSMARRSGARKELAQAHRALGIHLTSRRRWPEAEQRLTRALEIYRGLGTRWEVGRTLYHLGLLHHLRHSAAYRDQAKAVLDEANAIFSGLGDKCYQRRVLDILVLLS